MPGTAFPSIYKLLRPVGFFEFLLLASPSMVPTSLWGGRMHEQINKWKKFGPWSGGGFQWVSCDSDQVKWRQWQAWPLSESFFPSPWNSVSSYPCLSSFSLSVYSSESPEKMQLNCSLPCPSSIHLCLLLLSILTFTGWLFPQGSVPGPHFSIECAGPPLL